MEDTIEQKFDTSWMKEKNDPDALSNWDTEGYEPRDVINDHISLITRYVDDVNKYFLNKDNKVWLFWSYSVGGFDLDIHCNSDYFIVWGSYTGSSERKPLRASMVFHGQAYGFRKYCTKENLDGIEKYILKETE